MQFKSLALTVASAAVAAAGDSIFGVISIHSGSEIQNAGWNAVHNAIFNLATQNASCELNQEVQHATFYLTEKEQTLDLFSNSAPWQQLWVDRSGMGQGKMGFGTPADGAPKNAERTGFTIEDGQLKFGGAGFSACPGYEGGAYEIWANVVEHPAGNNCTGIIANVIESTDPVSCYYQ